MTTPKQAQQHSAEPLDLEQFEGHTPGPVYAVEWEGERVSLYTTGNEPHDFILGSSKDSVKGKAYEEIAKRANATPSLLAELRAVREQRDALRKALEKIQRGPATPLPEAGAGSWIYYSNALSGMQGIAATALAESQS